MANENEKNGQLQIEVKPETAHGIYSNLAVVTHSPNEFVLDFVSMLPGMPKAEVVSRIILVPEHAKRLMLALQDNVMRYEKEFGQIPLDTRANTGAPVPPRTANPFGEA